MIISTPYGTITSPNATVTVISQNILIYKYSGNAKVITAGTTTATAYAGQLFFIPDTTNGLFVGWAKINGKKQYWVNPMPNYLLINVSGAARQSFTILGTAGQGIDDNGYPHIWMDLHKGANAQLIISGKKTLAFPTTFANAATSVYPSPATGKWC
ncbi:MAG: hypothetical protein WDN00_01340 [Limisphaerales bacterium]